MAAPQCHDRAARPILLGRITGVHGVRGWLRIESHTRPRENLLEYRPWLIGTEPDWAEYDPVEVRVQGRGLIARFKEIDDPEKARALVNAGVAVRRDVLPRADAGQYYWCDLLGLTVRGADGRDLGKVVEIRETGSNDVLVVEGTARTLVPFLPGQVIRKVDLDAGVIDTGWDAEPA